MILIIIEFLRNNDKELSNRHKSLSIEINRDIDNCLKVSSVSSCNLIRIKFVVEHLIQMNPVTSSSKFFMHRTTTNFSEINKEKENTWKIINPLFALNFSFYPTNHRKKTL